MPFLLGLAWAPILRVVSAEKEEIHVNKTKTFTRTQLEAARKPLWHTAGNGLLTIDDAAEWLAEVGLVPYLPLMDKLSAPAPSFAEAVLGRPEKGHVVPVEEEPSEDISLAVEVAEREPEEEDDEAAAEQETEEKEEDKDAELDAEANASAEVEAPAKPEPPKIDGFSPEEVETVRRMLARLVAEGAAVPLNLLGTVGEMPDFICSPQAFSFVYTLRGDKTYKQPPSTTAGMKVSPLALHVWESLKDKGEQTTLDLAAEMGAGITGAAVLRALSELWQIGRVLPLITADGSAAKWELMTSKFTRPIKAGSNAGLPTAISALMSLYLPTAIAASNDEIETFLSPLAARSRVREIVNNLHQTKQLETNVVAGKTLFYIAGTLPEFPEVEEPVVEQVEQVSRYERAPSNYPVRTPAAKRDAQDERERRPFTRRAEGEGAAGEERPKRAYGKREYGDRPQRDFSDKPKRDFTKPWDEERTARGPRREGGDRPAFSRSRGEGDRERRPFMPREGGERRPFTPRGDGERRPFVRREDGDGPRRNFGSREAGDRKPFTPRGEGERRPYQRREGGDRPRRSFTPREGGDRSRRSFGSRDGGDSRSFTPRGDGERRPYQRREDGDRPRRPFAPHEGGDRSRESFGSCEGGERKPFTPRSDGERRPYQRREESNRPRKPFAPREGGERRPFTPREGGAPKKFGGSKFGGAPRGGAKFGGKPGGFAKKGTGGPRKGPGFGPGRGGAPKRRGGSDD